MKTFFPVALQTEYAKSVIYNLRILKMFFDYIGPIWKIFVATFSIWWAGQVVVL